MNPLDSLVGADTAVVTLTDTVAAVVRTTENVLPVPVYISWLTLAITVIAAGFALLNIAGVFLLDRARRQTAESRKEIDDTLREFRNERDKLSGLLAEARQRDAEIGAVAAAVRQSAGAFFPSGYFLSTRVRELLTVEERAECQCGRTLGLFQERLSLAFLANAEFGQQIQKLYLGDRAAVLAAATYLTTMPSAFALSVLAERLGFERVKGTPDTEVIVRLAQAVAEVDRELHRSARPL